MFIEKHPVLDEKFTEDITFYFDEQPLKAKQGQTVAGALMASGIRQFGRSRKLLQARGLFCANGRCMSCFVTINGLDHALSCNTLVEDGMKVSSNNSDPDVRGDQYGD